MTKIKLTKRALEETKRLNSLKKCLRLARSSTVVLYQVVGSVSNDDEIIDCGGVLVLIDRYSTNYFDGAEINYSDNPGWSYNKSS